MARDARGLASREIQTLFGIGAAGGLSDAQLLARFAARRDGIGELAFGALVERHGPMVRRVCRAILQNPDSADDAFQATFLVLVRKAESLWAGDSLGPWLHRVARRTAWRARWAEARRRRHERSAAGTEADRAGRPDRDDLEEVIQEEINRLPERFREAVVLCLLEGMTPEEAAKQLGCPPGTIHSRLARGRERLRGRLARRRLAPGAAGVVVPPAAVPARLVDSTVRVALQSLGGSKGGGELSSSVAALTEGVLRSMTMSKLKTAGGIALLLGAGMLGVVGFAQTGILLEPQLLPPGPRMKYELRVWKDGKPAGDPVVVEAPRGVPVLAETPDGPIEIRPVPERKTQAQIRREELLLRQAADHRHEGHTFYPNMLKWVQEYLASKDRDPQKIWVVHGLGYRANQELAQYFKSMIIYHNREADRLEAAAEGRAPIGREGPPPTAPPLVPIEEMERAFGPKPEAK